MKGQRRDLLDREARLVRERMVGAAHEVKAIGAELARQQVAVGRRARGREREVGLAAAHQRHAGVGQRIV
jgi:hypothetical protein